MKKVIESILDYMTKDGAAYDIQKVQTAHRIKLVESWGIKPGSRILEIGCGQGDTTAVLAHFVGENGMVHGVDIASPSYGSPITLGESAEKLRQSRLGSRIKIEFNKDILSPDVNYPENSFDYIVFSHCSWYLPSRDDLLSILKKVGSWGKSLCFAEWSTDISSIEQYPHLLAVLIQAQYEAYKQGSESNIRTLFTPQDIRIIVEEAGWSNIEDTTINSPDLQDGKWEIDMVLGGIYEELKQLKNIPKKQLDLIQSEVTMLQTIIETTKIRPLSVYSLTAR